MAQPAILTCTEKFSPQDLDGAYKGPVSRGGCHPLPGVCKGNQQHDGFWWPDPGLKTEVSATQADTGILEIYKFFWHLGFLEAILGSPDISPPACPPLSSASLYQLLSSSFTLWAVYPEKPQHTREQTFTSGRPWPPPPRCHGAGNSLQILPMAQYLFPIPHPPLPDYLWPCPCAVLKDALSLSGWWAPHWMPHIPRDRWGKDLLTALVPLSLPLPPRASQTFPLRNDQGREVPFVPVSRPLGK